MNKEIELISGFEFLGNRFEITEEFKQYNSIRNKQELKVYEIEEHYFELDNKMQTDMFNFIKPEALNFSSLVKTKVNTIMEVASVGFIELQRYQRTVLPEIGKRLIFKYTKNDTVSSDDIACNLEIDVEKYFSEFMDDVQQIENMKQSLEVKREYRNLTRQDPSFSGIGFGFKGAVGAAAGATVANAGLGLLRGIGDAIGQGINDSQVDKETKKGIEKAKAVLVFVFSNLAGQVNNICTNLLYDEMEMEIAAIGRKPYKQLSEEQIRDIKIKAGNYDQAYANGDITAEKYVTHIFGLINDVPYGYNHYYNLYRVAASIGDNDAKERILKFAQYLGLEKRINSTFVQEGIEKLEEIKTMSENNLAEIDKKLAVISGLMGNEIETETKRLKKRRHAIVNGFIAVNEEINYGRR